MSSPKEKAKELVDKYKIIIADDVVDMKIIYGTLTNKLAKQCALIAVDEILNIENVKPYILHKEIINYYTKVKQEIEKL